MDALSVSKEAAGLQSRQSVTSNRMLDHLFAYLKDEAQVAAFGAKVTPPPLGWLFNLFFRLMSKKWLSNSPRLTRNPGVYCQND
jgi:hypothetical protein